MKAAAVLLAVGLMGCVEQHSEARARAANDLKCPYEEVQVWADRRAPTADPDGWRAANGIPTRVHARGCGLATEYSCFYAYRSGEICLHEPPPQVSTDSGPPEQEPEPEPKSVTTEREDHESFVHPALQ